MIVELRAVTSASEMKLRALPQEGIGYFVFGIEKKDEPLVQIALPYRTENEELARAAATMIQRVYTALGWDYRFFCQIDELPYANIILPTV